MFQTPFLSYQSTLAQKTVKDVKDTNTKNIIEWCPTSKFYVWLYQKISMLWLTLVFFLVRVGATWKASGRSSRGHQCCGKLPKLLPYDNMVHTSVSLALHHHTIILYVFTFLVFYSSHALLVFHVSLHWCVAQPLNSGSILQAKPFNIKYATVLWRHSHFRTAAWYYFCFLWVSTVTVYFVACICKRSKAYINAFFP